MIRKKLNYSYIRDYFFPPKIKPVLGPAPFGGPQDSKYTFVMVVRGGYDYNLSNANSSIRLGFCRGFEQLGIGYRIVSVYNLEKELEEIDFPIIFLSCYDYLDFGSGLRKKLRNYKHFVWGAPNPGRLEEIYSKFDYRYEDDLGKNIFKTVSSSNPDFIFAPVTDSALENYSHWRSFGCRIESIPLACDNTKYYPVENKIPFQEMNDVVFVGGYWPKKAIQFDKYLRPLEKKLKVFGYSKWPYEGYGGLLDEEKERVLYCNAKAAPALSEPHAEFTGDIVERVFKIMGSGGLAVPDVNRYYREVFLPAELFVPETVAQYYDFINSVLKDRDLNEKCRAAGHSAVMEKHLYIHRAKKIFKLLGLSEQ